ncbi:MAG: TraB/GumN family protein [Proteobacteria bacterium]|nr:TraB/GumN family protein [Pseudomonadota bacterium]
MNIRLRWLALVLGATLLAAALARADDALEEVLVTGQQPGPGLWKVTRPGDPHGHVLWILGNYSPLPKNMTWRSSELAAVLAASQAVLAPVSVSASAGPLGGITLLPSLIGVRSNPDDKRLQEVVPADLYARWLPLKARYLGNDDRVEAWRPIFAAQELYRVALKKHELVPYDGVWPAVEKLARKARVPITEPGLELKVEKARAAIKEFKSTPLADVECFSRTLQRLESDLDLMRERANAWAAGDVARLRKLAPIERASACIGVVLESPFMRQRGLGDVLERTRNAWVAAAEKSLASNESTVAVLSVDEILKPDGYVAQLKNRGYVVTDP